MALDPGESGCPRRQLDPYRLIDGFLHGSTAASVDAEQVFLAWLLSLEPAVDPADAALDLLSGLAAAAVTPAEARGARLVALLHATTRWPRPALDQIPAGRRREAQEPS